MNKIEFTGSDGTFRLKQAENTTGLYFPLAGEQGLKSAITPNLGGDSKTDQNHFLLEPTSIENLHNNKSSRNFWCKVEGQNAWSVCGVSAMQEAQKFTPAQDDTELEAGFLWQTVTRTSKACGLSAAVTSFVTLGGALEVTKVALTNNTDAPLTFTPYGAVPIYGRSADNLRDHRHVTSLLHRIRTTEYGVEVRPVLSFDERGHQKNDTTYFVYGFEADGTTPLAFYPTVEDWIGEGGSFLNPAALRTDAQGVPAGQTVAGKEAMGAFRFAPCTLAPGQTTAYLVLAGVAEAGQKPQDLVADYRTADHVDAALAAEKIHWRDKLDIHFATGSAEVDNYLSWIEFQPILRRIYGCSFLPYHDYGKGGRGWRDLWQDCLALLLMDPAEVRQMILDNFGGVRFDGTNATIIGAGRGEFIADRNNITRVWMDHAFWPFVTTKFYLDQTGDADLLFSKVTYFKDLQAERSTAHDEHWVPANGNLQRTAAGEICHGTVLEHLLLQNLCAFYDVGDHNEILLHGADWNDALDMASHRGESVAFTCAFAGNLQELAEVLRKLQTKNGYSKAEIADELLPLLKAPATLYDDPAAKRVLLRRFTGECRHTVSGHTTVVSLAVLANRLQQMADWMFAHIRKTEWVADGKDGWFNGYYDDHGNAVERCVEGDVRMMLTGQVFAVMSGTATQEQTAAITRSADKYLYDEPCGGYRLNTNFHEEKFDLGRMFGFAYGEKENGAVFSHMAVMYANALYRRGFATEGHKALQALLNAAMHFETSHLYPGLPEYFDNKGRGLYAYLTGAASWYLLTMVTEVFGIKGDFGDMLLAPALMPEQFDANHQAKIQLTFAGRAFTVTITNAGGIPCGSRPLVRCQCDGKPITCDKEYGARLTRAELAALDAKRHHAIDLVVSES